MNKRKKIKEYLDGSIGELSLEYEDESIITNVSTFKKHSLPIINAYCICEALNHDQDAIIEWCNDNIKQYQKLIKLIKKGLKK